jgi:autotransporter translocation and assembly factor TamB
VNLIAQGVLSAQQETALIYNMNLGDLSALQQYLGVALTAKGSISGEISGPLDALSTQGTMYLNELRYAGLNLEGLLSNFTAQNIATTPRAVINARLEGLQAPGLPRSSVQLEFNYRQPRGQISLAVTEGPYKQSQLVGSLIREAGYRGTIDRMHLRSGDWVWMNPQPIELVYDPQGAAELNNLLLENGNQRISARASLSQQGSISAEARISQLQIGPAILALAPDADAPDGLLSLDLQVEGNLEQPQLDGSLSMTSLRKQKQSLGEIRGRLKSSGTILNSDLRWTDEGVTLLDVQGTVDTGHSGALAMRMKIPEFDLERLTPLSKAVLTSAGRLDIDLSLEGTVQQPQAHGSIDIKDGQLQLAVIGETYTDIQSQIRLSGHRIEIEKLQVGSRTGRAQLLGWLELSGVSLRELDLSLKAKDFTAMHTSAIVLQASSDLTLRGSLQDMTASGDIDIPQARIRIDNLPTSEADEVQPWELTVSGVYGPGPEELTVANGEILVPIKKDPLPFLRAKIGVEIPRNAWVQGEGTAVEVRGKLQINKEREGPFVLGGYVETLRGFASFFGKKFDIETGRVTFTGARKINPRLDIIATQKVSDYSVYVDVTDRMDKPKITLRSDPELEQADILSLLLFGRTTESLSGSEQSSLSGRAAAGQLAGGLAAGVLERTLGKSLGLDTIAIDTGDADNGGGFGVGRYITQDIFLSYDRTFSNSQEQNRSGNTVGIEYSISRNLKIKSTSSDIGETAVDFSWSADY